jgi:hypothetical protein
MTEWSDCLFSSFQIQQTNVLFRLPWFVALPLLTSPLNVMGQAGLEYALKGGAALPGVGEMGSAIAGCHVDSALLTCLTDSYPRAAIVVGIVVGLLAMRALFGNMVFKAGR